MAFEQHATRRGTTRALAIRRSWRRWSSTRCLDESGTSAVEFALYAPALIVALLAAIDLGLAEFERMTIDHALRSAAQSAMADQGADAVLKVLRSTASRNFTVATGTTAGAGALAVSVDRFCACPDSTGVAVACSTTCPGSAPTYIYYRLSGSKTHSGMIMPAMALNTSAQVQVR